MCIDIYYIYTNIHTHTHIYVNVLLQNNSPRFLYFSPEHLDVVVVISLVLQMRTSSSQLFRGSREIKFVAWGPIGSKGYRDKAETNPWLLTSKSRTFPFTAAVLHSGCTLTSPGVGFENPDARAPAQYNEHRISGCGAQVTAYLERFPGDPKVHACSDQSGDQEPSHAQR